METFMGLRVLRHSPAKVGSKSRGMLAAAFREVSAHEPSTVKRAHVKGRRKRKMLAAIAYSKARKAGASV